MQKDFCNSIGQKQTSSCECSMSAVPSTADMHRGGGYVSFVPIVLKKSFLGDERNFLEALMRFACGDVRDHIVSRKTDHGPSYQRYGALQR
jgi:hypothetical protein